MNNWAKDKLAKATDWISHNPVIALIGFVVLLMLVIGVARVVR